MPPTRFHASTGPECRPVSGQFREFFLVGEQLGFVSVDAPPGRRGGERDAQNSLSSDICPVCFESCYRPAAWRPDFRISSHGLPGKLQAHWIIESQYGHGIDCLDLASGRSKVLAQCSLTSLASSLALPQPSVPNASRAGPRTGTHFQGATSTLHVASIS